MGAKMFFTGSTVLLAAAMVAIAAGQSPSLHSPASTTQPAPQQPPQSNDAAKMTTRPVTLDVVATDSHGDVVRDLKPEEFEIFDRGRQEIAQFAFIDNSANIAAAKPSNTAPPRPSGVYTNHAPFERLTTPPTVVLLDALNSEGPDQKEARRHMIRLLNTLPPGTPVAVFLLGQSLTVVQDFSSDPAVLRAAVDKRGNRSASPSPASENVSHSWLLATQEANSGQENYVSQQFEDFEKQDRTDTMNFRVAMTVSALTNIGRYLSGYPGRKNLLWVSASYPISFEPKPALEKDTFGETRAYGEKVQDAAGALADAQVAVYPLDARVAGTEQVPSAPGGNSIAAIQQGTLRGSIDSERQARVLTLATMDGLAGDTGGKACKNTDNLSGCVAGAVKDSSSYYALAYNPQNVNGDGSLLEISVKTTRPGILLSYRRDYFAQDAEARAERQPAQQQLEQACKDVLPSTAIPLAAQVAPRGPGGGLTYLLSAPPGALSLTPPGQSDELSARTALCEYGGQGDSIQFLMMGRQTVSEATYQIWQARGFQEYVDVPPMADAGWVRIAVVDTRTGLTGALDIPMRAEDLAMAAAPPATLPAAPENPPEAVPENSPSPPAYSITFRASSGAASALDWNGDKLSYQGGINVGQTAPAYFHDAFGAKFHCEAGELTPRDASGAKPDLHFSFGNPSGQTAVVDLTGSEPQYSGDLPVDPSAKPFFETLWYLCHCRAAPQNLADAPRN